MNTLHNLITYHKSEVNSLYPIRLPQSYVGSCLEFCIFTTVQIIADDYSREAIA